MLKQIYIRGLMLKILGRKMEAELLADIMLLLKENKEIKMSLNEFWSIKDNYYKAIFLNVISIILSLIFRLTLASLSG